MKRPLGYVILLWLLVNLFFLLTKGIMTGGEAEKYIYQAGILIQTGHLSTSSYWLYFFPIYFLSVCERLHLGFGYIVGFQWVVSLGATIFFFQLIHHLIGSAKIALVGTFLLLLNVFYQSFNISLQTESLFDSFILLFSCYVLTRRTLSTLSLVLILFGLIILSFSRPNGAIFWPATSAYLLFFCTPNLGKRQKWLFLGLTIVGFLIIVNSAMGTGGLLDFMRPFREEHIICGSPTLLHPADIITVGSGNSLYSLFYYIIHHFKDFSRLAFLKTVAFWTLYRSYFSLAHNIYLILYFQSIHLMALFSIPYWWRQKKGAFFFLTAVVFLTWITVILTCDDWHNRFYLTISPFLLLLSLPAFQTLGRHLAFMRKK
jgi:hypothetical protein